MEIERKWLVTGWPAGLAETSSYKMRQGYIALRPTVRIRSEEKIGGPVRYVLCFKGKGGLAREEIETDISPELFARLEAFIGRPLVEKQQRRYALGGGLSLEVNWVDAGEKSEFLYAEVEFESEKQAHAWQPQGVLAAYLDQEVTDTPGQSMGAYWEKTRLGD